MLIDIEQHWAFENYKYNSYLIRLFKYCKVYFLKVNIKYNGKLNSTEILS